MVVNLADVASELPLANEEVTLYLHTATIVISS